MTTGQQPPNRPVGIACHNPAHPHKIRFGPSCDPAAASAASAASTGPDVDARPYLPPIKPGPLAGRGPSAETGDGIGRYVRDVINRLTRERDEALQLAAARAESVAILKAELADVRAHLVARTTERDEAASLARRATELANQRERERDRAQDPQHLASEALSGTTPGTPTTPPDAPVTPSPVPEVGSTDSEPAKPRTAPTPDAEPCWCGQPATHECPEAGSIACGRPLCDQHTLCLHHGAR